MERFSFDIIIPINCATSSLADVQSACAEANQCSDFCADETTCGCRPGRTLAALNATTCEGIMRGSSKVQSSSDSFITLKNKLVNWEGFATHCWCYLL